MGAAASEGPQVVHPTAAGSEDRRHADLKPSMSCRVERDGNRSAVPDRAADSVRMSAHEGHPGAGDCPVRVDVPVTLGRTLVTRKSLVGRSLLISRALGGALRCG
jgi:hypothetical protein